MRKRLPPQSLTGVGFLPSKVANPLKSVCPPNPPTNTWLEQLVLRTNPLTMKARCIKPPSLQSNKQTQLQRQERKPLHCQEQSALKLKLKRKEQEKSARYLFPKSLQQRLWKTRSRRWNPSTPQRKEWHKSPSTNPSIKPLPKSLTLHLL